MTDAPKFDSDELVDLVRDALRDRNIEVILGGLRILAAQDPARAQQVLATAQQGLGTIKTGPKAASQNEKPPSSDAPDRTEAAEIYRPVRRAVLHLSTQLLEQILGLPDDVEVLHIAPGHHGLSLAVIVTSPDMPEVDPACAPWELTPSYALVDGRPQLVDLGIPKAASR